MTPMMLFRHAEWVLFWGALDEDAAAREVAAWAGASRCTPEQARAAVDLALLSVAVAWQRWPDLTFPCLGGAAVITSRGG